MWLRCVSEDSSFCVISAKMGVYQLVMTFNCFWIGQRDYGKYVSRKLQSSRSWKRLWALDFELWRKGSGKVAWNWRKFHSYYLPSSLVPLVFLETAKQGENILGKWNTNFKRDTISIEEYYRHLQTAFRTVHINHRVRAKAKEDDTSLVDRLVSEHMWVYPF